jgi:hypothetical protein
MPPVFCKLNQALVFFCCALEETISGHGGRCLVAVSRRMLLHIENQAGETRRTASGSAPALLSSAPEHTDRWRTGYLPPFCYVSPVRSGT